MNMKYIQEVDEDTFPKDEEVWFNKDGNEVEGANQQFFAKTLVRNGRRTYHIREQGGLFCDPIGIYANRRFREDVVKSVLVAKEVFDLYLVYLKTKNSSYLTKAQRRHTHG